MRVMLNKELGHGILDMNPINFKVRALVKV